MSPGPAGILVHEDNAVFIPFVHRARRAGADTGWIEQCSQIRGRYIINTSSNSVRILFSIFSTFGSCSPVIWAPARSSSQFGPHRISINSPVKAILAGRQAVFSVLGCLSMFHSHSSKAHNNHQLSGDLGCKIN